MNARSAGALFLVDCRSALNAFCRGADHFEDPFRLREHRHMATVELIVGCIHALCRQRYLDNISVGNLAPNIRKLLFDYSLLASGSKSRILMKHSLPTAVS